MIRILLSVNGSQFMLDLAKIFNIFLGGVALIVTLG